MYFNVVSLLAAAALAAPAPASAPPSSERPTTLIAEPQLNPDSAFSITKLSAEGYAGVFKNATALNKISFSVHDPDARTNASTVCTVAWNATSQAPSQLSFCKDRAWQVRVGGGEYDTGVQGWHGPSRFGVSVVHLYHDASLGPPPYDWRQTFAHGNVTVPSVVCSGSSSADATTTRARQTCRLRQGATVELAVYGVSS